jgi:dolichyl-phosphate-mannose-protein mannosyltransferase
LLRCIHFKHSLVSLAGRLWRISFPNGVVFDESHFGKFTRHYQRGTYVFDIHPPLGKITFAVLGWLVGYDNEKCEYEDIGEEYGPECQYWKLRGISATFGSAVRW